MTATSSSGKWIEGMDGATPLVEAAGLVLDSRLKAVERMVPLAHKKPHEDDEHVHDLRVAARRAGAALRIFAPCIGRGLDKSRSRLKRLRRAAGDARECDVHRRILQEDLAAIGGGEAAVLRDAIEWLEGLRRGAQRRIAKAVRRYPVGKLRRARRRLVRSLSAPETAPRTLAEHGRITMPDLVDELRRLDAADLSEFENLHALRIATKRLRYALEVFAPCFGPDFPESYALVESLQARLGEINDTHEIAQRLEEYAGSLDDPDRVAAARSAVEIYLRRRRERSTEFLRDWKRGQRATLLRALDRLAVGEPALAGAAGAAGEAS